MDVSGIIVIGAIVAVIVYAIFKSRKTSKEEREIMPELTPEEEAMMSDSNAPAEEIAKENISTQEVEKKVEEVEAEKKVIEERLSKIENPDKNKPFAKIGGVSAEETAAEPSEKKKRKYNKKAKPAESANTEAKPSDSTK